MHTSKRKLQAEHYPLILCMTCAFIMRYIMHMINAHKYKIRKKAVNLSIREDVLAEARYDIINALDRIFSGN